MDAFVWAIFLVVESSCTLGLVDAAGRFREVARRKTREGLLADYLRIPNRAALQGGVFVLPSGSSRDEAHYLARWAHSWRLQRCVFIHQASAAAAAIHARRMEDIPRRHTSSLIIDVEDNYCTASLVSTCHPVTGFAVHSMARLDGVGAKALKDDLEAYIVKKLRAGKKSRDLRTSPAGLAALRAQVPRILEELQAGQPLCSVQLQPQEHGLKNCALLAAVVSREDAVEAMAPTSKKICSFMKEAMTRADVPSASKLLISGHGAELVDFAALVTVQRQTDPTRSIVLEGAAILAKHLMAGTASPMSAALEVCKEEWMALAHDVSVCRLERTRPDLVIPKGTFVPPEGLRERLPAFVHSGTPGGRVVVTCECGPRHHVELPAAPPGLKVHIYATVFPSRALCAACLSLELRPHRNLRPTTPVPSSPMDTHAAAAAGAGACGKAASCSSSKRKAR